MDEFNKIMDSDLPEVDKVAEAFKMITDRVVAAAGQEIELARALGDQESLIKEQIKSGVMKMAQAILHHCYRGATGRKAWNDENRF